MMTWLLPRGERVSGIYVCPASAGRTWQHCCKRGFTIARHGLIHMFMSTDNDWSYCNSTM